MRVRPAASALAASTIAAMTLVGAVPLARLDASLAVRLHATRPSAAATAVVLRTPHTTAEYEDAAATSVSCVRPGSCLAVGTYEPAAASRALVWLRHGSRWAVGRPVALPVGAVASSSSTLTSVSCAAPGECLAVGTYTAAHASGPAGMLVRVVHGSTERAVELTLPSHEHTGQLATWCSTRGACVITGTMATPNGLARAFAARLSLASSAPPTIVRLPYRTPTQVPHPNDGGSLSMPALSCTAVGDCLLAGTVTWQRSTTPNSLPVVEVETDSRWGPVRVSAMPNDAGTVSGAPVFTYDAFEADACAAHACTAVGTYAARSDAGEELLVASLLAGRLHLGTAAISPTDGAYSAVACAPDGTCVAAGTLYDALVPGSEEGEYSIGTTSQFITDLPTPVPEVGGEELDTFTGAAFVLGAPTPRFLIAGSEIDGGPTVPILVSVPL